MPIIRKGRRIGSIGDCSPFDHGGGHIYRADGRHTLWYTMGAECDDAAVIEVYRVDIPKDPDGFWDCLDWADIDVVAEFIGMDRHKLARSSDTLLGRALALEAIGSYYGWRNLDGYPVSLTRSQLGPAW